MRTLLCVQEHTDVQSIRPAWGARAIRGPFMLSLRNQLMLVGLLTLCLLGTAIYLVVQADAQRQKNLRSQLEHQHLSLALSSLTKVSLALTESPDDTAIQTRWQDGLRTLQKHTRELMVHVIAQPTPGLMTQLKAIDTELIRLLEMSPANAPLSLRQSRSLLEQVESLVEQLLALQNSLLSVARTEQSALPNYQLLLLSLVVLLLFTLILRLSLRTLPRLHMLRQAADKVAQGDWQIRLPALTSHNEIDQAFASFNHMLNALAQAHQETECLRHEAETAHRRQSDLLHSMRREFSTPINGILGVCASALEDCVTPAQHQRIKKIHNSTRALREMMNGLLDYACMEIGAIAAHTEDFDLEELLHTTVTLFVPAAEEKGLELSFQLEPSFHLFYRSEAGTISHVLYNLLSNAIKYTHKGSITISVDTEEGREHHTNLRFRVTDTGIGIPESQVKQICEPFVQLPNPQNAEYRGLGLGLTISKRMVEQLKGRFEMSSVPGQGTRVCFSIPVEKVSSAQAKTTGILHPRKVLVVDDQVTTLVFFEKVLRYWGFEVHCAPSVAEAIMKIEHAQRISAPFDFFLIDWRLPGTFGTELVLLLRERQRRRKLSKDAQIIMMTAQTDNKVVETLQRYGERVDAFLHKPTAISTLFNVLNSLQITAKGELFGLTQPPASIQDVRQRLAPIHGASVLVAEDNTTNQMVISEILEQLNLHCTLASNGEEAIARLDKAHFDCILMDVQMPVMDGFEATRRIRSLARYRDLPIIALSAAALVQDIERALRSGMNAHLSKPVEFEQLASALLLWIRPKNTDDQAPSSNSDIPELMDRRDIAELTSTKLLDLPGLKQKTGGNMEFVIRLLKAFSSDFAKAPELLRSSLQQGNLETAEPLVHSLKGASGNINAPYLNHLACQVDEELKQGRSETLPEMIQALENCLHAIRRHLR